MSFQIDSDWWKYVFDELYLLTDHRTVCNSKLTGQEVDLIEKFLPIEKSSRILDLCGGHGRHCLELNRRGYLHLICLDYSLFLVQHGKQNAEARLKPVQFIRADARQTGLKDAAVDAVMMMTNSFGYFTEDKDNRQIMKEVYRVLRPGGYLMLDLLNPDYVTDNFKNISWHEVEPDMVVCRQRWLDDSIIKARELILSRDKGLIRENNYCAFLYTAGDIQALLDSVGFYRNDIKCTHSFPINSADQGFMENRMIAVAQKPAV
ncbi:MAG: class I SAM-dependent methyltransferase [bacterium]|nr:class I SAM-dependent methyltransferase [bacterium]